MVAKMILISCFCLSGAAMGLSQTRFTRLATPPHSDLAFDGVLMHHAQQQQTQMERETEGARDRPFIHLLTSIFMPEEGKELGHVQEILAAFAVNVENHMIASVHVLFESHRGDCSHLAHHMKNVTGRAAKQMAKVVCVFVDKQPTYHDFFQYASDHMPNNHVLLSNADVVFDGTLGLISPLSAGAGHVISVRPPPYAGDFRNIFKTECVIGENRCLDWTTSWDAYVFVPPLPTKLKEFDLRFPMNILKAENFAASALVLSGVNLTNACGHVHAYHWHCLYNKMHATFQTTPSWPWEIGFGPCAFPEDCHRGGKKNKLHVNE